MPTSINCSMVVVVNDGLWISSITVIHNIDHYEFFKLNNRCCERWHLNFAKGRRCMNDRHCHSVPTRTSLVIIFKPAIKFGFFILKVLFTSKTPTHNCKTGLKYPKCPIYIFSCQLLCFNKMFFLQTLWTRNCFYKCRPVWINTIN